jgi:hypothetical protein
MLENETEFELGKLGVVQKGHVLVGMLEMKLEQLLERKLVQMLESKTEYELGQLWVL